MCNKNISTWNLFIYFNTFGIYSIFPPSECVHCNITKSRGCATVEGIDGSLVFLTPLVYCHVHIKNSPNIEEHRQTPCHLQILILHYTVCAMGSLTE